MSDRVFILQTSIRGRPDPNLRPLVAIRDLQSGRVHDGVEPHIILANRHGLPYYDQQGYHTYECGYTVLREPA